MAQEILVLDIAKRGREGFTVRCLFLHPLDPPLSVVGGGTFAPTPSADLPTEVVALNLLSAQELSDLDSGDLAYEQRSLLLTKSEEGSAPQVLAKIRALYASSGFVQELRARYAHLGRRINP